MQRELCRPIPVVRGDAGVGDGLQFSVVVIGEASPLEGVLNSLSKIYRLIPFFAFSFTKLYVPKNKTE